MMSNALRLPPEFVQGYPIGFEQLHGLPFRPCAFGLSRSCLLLLQIFPLLLSL